MEININNKTYRKKELKSKSKHLNKVLLPALLLCEDTYMFTSQGKINSSTSKLECYSEENLIEEYKLIIEKKSKLSSSERRRIINWFEKTFVELTN